MNPTLIRLLALEVVVLCLVVPIAAQQQVNLYDIDVSKSMLKNNMFAAAQQALIDHVRILPIGVHIVVIKFGLTADVVIDRRITSDRDRQDIIEAIRWLAATHDYTQFDEMVKQTKLICYDVRSRYNDQVTIGITVLSDGISSPNKTIGKVTFNLESIVTQTFPQSRGFNVYLVSLEEARTKRPVVIDPEKVNRSGVVTVVVPADSIAAALRRINTIERGRHEAAVSKSGTVNSNDKKEDISQYLPVIIAIVVIIAAASVGFYYLRNKKGLDRITKELNRSTQLAAGKTNVLKARLRVQETLLDKEGKINDSQPEQLLRIRPNSSFSLGKDAKTCSFVMKSEKAPAVLVSLTFGDTGESMELRNETAFALQMNNHPVKSSHSKRFTIDEKVTMVSPDQIVITLERVLVRNDRKSESDFLAKLVNENQTNKEETISQQS